MLIKSLLMPKESLNLATIEMTIADTLALMEQHNVRCLPVLDSSKTLFKGNIYRYHIYRHIAKGGLTTSSIVPLIKNATKFIHINDSFFSLLFTLNDLSYISVLDDNQHFVGIIYHTHVMTMLSQCWNLSESSYSLSIELPEKTTSFLHLIKLVKKYAGISNVITFERDDYYLRKRALITLPKQLDERAYDKLKRALQKHQYHIIEIEDLTNGI